MLEHRNYYIALSLFKKMEYENFEAMLIGKAFLKKEYINELRSLYDSINGKDLTPRDVVMLRQAFVLGIVLGYKEGLEKSTHRTYEKGRAVEEVGMVQRLER